MQDENSDFSEFSDVVVKYFPDVGLKSPSLRPGQFRRETGCNCKFGGIVHVIFLIFVNTFTTMFMPDHYKNDMLVPNIVAAVNQASVSSVLRAAYSSS